MVNRKQQKIWEKKYKVQKVKQIWNFIEKSVIFQNEMNIRRQSGNFEFEEDYFTESAESFSTICHKVLLLIKIFTN